MSTLVSVTGSAAGIFLPFCAAIWVDDTVKIMNSMLTVNLRIVENLLI
jgi:hypothetical protein